ncbi:MAG: hypothetical protein RMY64_29865, partial [Nostoc sp. DedQUE08]|uniref:hypothetical protein n=1 Tax=Nostoc sp. DedQUE08 TaxID=3075393 RepID=UPI002AD4E2B6
FASMKKRLSKMSNPLGIHSNVVCRSLMSKGYKYIVASSAIACKTNCLRRNTVIRLAMGATANKIISCAIGSAQNPDCRDAIYRVLKDQSSTVNKALGSINRRL